MTATQEIPTPHVGLVNNPASREQLLDAYRWNVQACEWQAPSHHYGYRLTAHLPPVHVAGAPAEYDDTEVTYDRLGLALCDLLAYCDAALVTTDQRATITVTLTDSEQLEEWGNILTLAVHGDGTVEIPDHSKDAPQPTVRFDGTNRDAVALDRLRQELKILGYPVGTI